VPALNNVGDACVNQRSDNKLYVYTYNKTQNYFAPKQEMHVYTS